MYRIISKFERIAVIDEQESKGRKRKRGDELYCNVFLATIPVDPAADNVRVYRGSTSSVNSNIGRTRAGRVRSVNPSIGTVSANVDPASTLGVLQLVILWENDGFRADQARFIYKRTARAIEHELNQLDLVGLLDAQSDSVALQTRVKDAVQRKAVARAFATLNIRALRQDDRLGAITKYIGTSELVSKGRAGRQWEDIITHNGTNRRKEGRGQYRLWGSVFARKSGDALLHSPNAALVHPNGRAYFFNGDKYQRYNFSSDRVDKTARIGIDGWSGLKDTGVNAAVVHPNGHAYFFNGPLYQRYDFSKNAVGKEARINVDGWRGLPTSGVDAAIMHPNGKAYFFNGATYRRFDFASDQVEKTARIGIDGWNGLWDTGIDAALVHPNGNAYFFKGSNYQRFDFKTNSVDKIGHLGIDGWGLPNY